jgi:hypothetical protein
MTPNKFQYTTWFLFAIPYIGYWLLHQPSKVSTTDAVLQGTASGSTLQPDAILPIYTGWGFFIFFCLSIAILFGRQIINNLMSGNVNETN